MSAMSSTKFKTVDDYMSALPGPVRNLLETLRRTIKKAAPQAEEVISYNMPAFKLNGILVWYAAYKEHIGFYPKPEAIGAFEKRLTAYEGGKGTLRFPIDRPLPLGLISSMVKFRVKEDLAHALTTKTRQRSAGTSVRHHEGENRTAPDAGKKSGAGPNRRQRTRA